jgi:hypothetical protein
MPVPETKGEAAINWAKSFAHRELRHAAQYRNVVTDATAVPAYATAVLSHPHELLLGVYENVPGEATESILVTDQGLYIAGGAGWTYVRYEDISHVALPLPDDVPWPDRKHGADRVTITLATGHVIDVPVRGGTYTEDGTLRTHDVYLVYDFIRRTVAAMRTK